MPPRRLVQAAAIYLQCANLQWGVAAVTAHDTDLALIPPHHTLDGCLQIATCCANSIGPSHRGRVAQDIAAKLEHPAHRRRMALVCCAWRDATPITSYDVMMRPWQSLTALDSRLAVITARHTHLTALNFRCGLVRRASRHRGWHLNAPASSLHHTRGKTADGAAPAIGQPGHPVHCNSYRGLHSGAGHPRIASL